jgi:hypothetical protein
MALPRQAHHDHRAGRRSRSTQPDAAVHLTLLELVRTIGEITEDEAEIAATVIHMLRSGTVKLAGTFRDEPISRFAD